MDNNWWDFTYQEMADKLNLKLSDVTNYYKEKGYRKQDVTVPASVPTKKIVKLELVKTPIERPPASYSNTSREETIDKWLNAGI